MGYKLTLTRIKDEATIDKAAGFADARIKIDHIHWFIPQYTPNFQQQGMLSNQILRTIPTELRSIERSVFVEEVNNRNLWNLELGSQESTNVLVWITVGLQQRTLQDSQKLNDETFCRLPVTSCQCIIGTEKYPGSGIFVNYDDDDCLQVYAQIKEAIKALTQDDILKPYITYDNFRSSSIRAHDVGYNLYVFDIR